MSPIDNGITPSGFPLCDVEDFDNIGLTKIGKKLVLRNFTEVIGNQSQVQSLCMAYNIAVTHAYLTLSTLTRIYTGQRHEGSRDQHPRQAEGRDQHTVNGT